MEDSIVEYGEYLLSEERSSGTVLKYIRDVRRLIAFAEGREITKQLVISYKEELCRTYSVNTVNSMIAAINGYFSFAGEYSLRVKPLKKQREIFCKKERELTKEEYYRLLRTAEHCGKRRISLIMQTICSTGIRISELKYITAAAAKTGRAQVRCKGKLREIFIGSKLKELLKAYIKQNGIAEGPIFVTRSGKPVDRGNVWREMKKLCKEADVDESKVFPHNLRHLFAREFYSVEKDIAKLADVLGHSNIETTRIYIMEDGDNHQKIISRMGLVI